MAEGNEKRVRVRAKRRDYQKDLSDLKTYISVTIDAINAYVGDGPKKEGQLESLRAVLSRLEPKA